MKNTFLLALLLLVVVGYLNSPVVAQNPESSPPRESSAVSTSSPPPIQQAPVTVPEPDVKAMSYYESGNVLWAVNTVLGLLIPFLFLQTRLSARLRDIGEKISSKWFFVVPVYFVLFTVINYLIGLPLEYYQGFIREHAYGLSNQSFGKWLTNSLTSLAVGLIIGILLLWIPYLLLRRSPRRWWLYTSILLVPFYCLAILVTPIWIDPLFNNYSQMKDKQLEAKILALADRAGIEGSRVYEVDKSADTNAVNAFVTGFASTKRIVLWDTIISKLDEDELLFVVGHEMGHYVLGHIWKTLALLSALTFALLYAAYRLSEWLIARYGSRWGFSSLADPAALPLILLIIGALTLIISPLLMAYSRSNEHEADRFGLEITRSNHAAATAFVKLQTENLSNPRPGTLVKWLRFDHPPIGERIDFCNSYKPWESGEPLIYGDLFRQPPAK